MGKVLVKRVVTCLFLVIVLLSFHSTANETTRNPNELQPIVERKKVFDAVLDTENFEIGAQVGVISIEDFENSQWLTGHLAYHITEFFYVKARYSEATAGQSSFEKLSYTSPLLTDEQREITYYGLNIGYNLLPGEVFIGDGVAFNSVFSIELGAGTTEFTGADIFTVNVSTNYRVFLTDWLALDVGAANYLFDTAIAGELKTTHNLTMTTGFSFFF